MLLLILSVSIHLFHTTNAIGCCSGKKKYRPRAPLLIRQLAEPLYPPRRPQRHPPLSIINHLISTHCPLGETVCNLDNKRIQNLDEAIFPPDITVLDLSHNKITSVHEVTFPLSLVELYLDSNNIQDVSGLDLSYLTSLKILAMGVNQIRSFQNVHLPNLKYLSLSGNQLHSFADIGYLAYVQTLEYLQLNRNAITALNGDLRQKLPASLKYLGLARNGLHEVNVTVPTSLRQLDIRSNPLHNVIVHNPEPGLVIYIDDIKTQRVQEEAELVATQKLPSLIWRYMHIEKQCIVCCEKFAKGDMVKTLPCMHQFHCKCIDPWLRRQKTCPDCRHDVNKVTV